MKENEFLDGVSNIESDVVERFISMDNKLQNKANKKPKRVWIRFGAIAACFLLIVSAVIVVPMLLRDDQGVVIPPDETSNSDIDSDVVTSLEDAKNNDDTSDAPGAVESTEDTSGNDDMWAVNIPDHIPITFDATESPDSLNGNSWEFIKGSLAPVSSGAADAILPNFEFSSGIVVKAKVVKNYPDKYYMLDVSSEYSPTAYRLIQMETIEVISGENVPQYFLYLIPEKFYVDMSIYDSLLISMSQIGLENYVLKNDTQNQIESFELLMFGDYQEDPEFVNIIAFTDGIFDESLWQTDTWFYGYHYAKFYLDNPESSNIAVARGDSESTVISAIKARYPAGYQEPSVITLDFKTQEAKDAVEYVKPFANGVFSQTFWPSHGNGQLIFRRYINGCQTEETIIIDLLTEEVTYSEVRYTKEDMMRMENISAHLSKKASEYAEQFPDPPHTDPDGKELLCLNLYAWYAKVDGKLYGVVKTAWRYQRENDYWEIVQYYDASYVLYDISAGTAAEISRDSLVAIIGTRNVTMEKYDVGYIMPTI